MCEMNKTLNETGSRSDSVKGRTSELEISNVLKQNTMRRENKKPNRALVSCGTSLSGLTHCTWNSQKKEGEGAQKKYLMN